MADFLIPAGRSWLVADSQAWPALVKERKADGKKTWAQKSTVENKDAKEVFVVAEFTESTVLPGEIVRKAGPVKNTEDPHILGVWKPEGPSWEHYLYEATDAAEDLADKAKNALDSITWLAWGVGIAGAVFLLRKVK